MSDKDETKRLETATLDIEKLKVDYWSLWQELGEIRKEIEGLNRTKEKIMTTNEAGKQKEQSMTFTFKGPISWQWKEDKEKPYLSEFIVGTSRPPTIEAPNATRPAHEIDDLIARHKATLDLLAKPAKSEPAECECVDKAKLQEYLADQIKESQKDKAYSAGKEWFTDAARNVHREFAFSAVKEAIEAGRFDRAPCKPEPAPERDPAWNAKGLDFGTEDYVNCSPQPAPSRPALGKKQVLRGLETIRGIFQNGAGVDPADVIQRFIREMENGGFDLPATYREHKCRCSTANLVEQLRARASVADGIDVTDLDADQLLTVGWNRSATVIMVPKEDRS